MRYRHFIHAIFFMAGGFASVDLLPKAYGQTPFRSICDRSPALKNHISYRLNMACGDIDASDLLSVTNLSIGASKPISFKEGDFENFFEVRRFDIDFDSVPYFPQNSFRDMGKLEYLSLSGNDFDLYPGIFRGLKSLKSFSMSNSGYYGGLFEPHILADLVGNPIVAIDVYAGNPGDIPVGGFYPLFPNLKTLNLRASKLDRLPDFAFKNLNQLSELQLMDNDISDIGSEVFLGCSALRSLGLWKNRLSKLKRDGFKGLDNIETLYIWENLISKIEPGSFDGLDKVKSINLSANRIEDLPDGLFNTLPNLKVVSLDGNPICVDSAKMKKLRDEYPTIRIDCGN